jgi:hypothetical protein
MYKLRPNNDKPFEKEEKKRQLRTNKERQLRTDRDKFPP